MDKGFYRLMYKIINSAIVALYIIVLIFLFLFVYWQEPLEDRKEVKINKKKFDAKLDYHGLLKGGSILEENRNTGELHFLDKKGRKCYFGNIKDFEEIQK